MLYIDDQFYDADYFSQQAEALAQHPVFSTASSQRIAVCIEDYAQWLAICFFCRTNNLSVMPIHPSTPLDAARRLSEKAQCQSLMYGSLDTVITLSHSPIAETTALHGIIQMSSGTTGDPKCIERSWASIQMEITSYIGTFTAPENMTPIIACPITHSYGLISGVLVALSRGVTPRIITSINPKYLIKVLKASDNPLLYSSPTMLQTVARLWPEGSTLHGAMTSGTIMSQRTYDALAPKVTHLFQQYGCSEVGCIAVNQHLNHTQDVGVPLPHLQVTAGTSAQETGEIVVSFTTYDPAIHGATACVKTRDLGYIQHDTHNSMLTFVSRLDDTIIVAGLNVYPVEVEDIVLTHPDVVDAVVFKRDDPYAGQRVCLHYVTHTQLTPSDLRQWCTDKMAPYQIPQQVESIDHITRLANGKVNRRLIANEYEALLTQRKHDTIAAPIA